MVEFAGFMMPVQYTSIIQEHQTTRSIAGMADISHMGRLRFEGPGMAVFLAELLTRRVADMVFGQIRYSLITNEQGGILDDVLVGYYHNEYGQPFYVLVVNASNHEKIVRWINQHLPPERANRPGDEVIFTDRQPALGDVRHPRSAGDRFAPAFCRRRSEQHEILPRESGPALAPGRPKARGDYQPHRLYRRRRF